MSQLRCCISTDDPKSDFITYFKRISCNKRATSWKVVLRVANLFFELEIKLQVARYFLRVTSCFVRL